MTIVKKIKASRIAKINDIIVEILITINHNSKFTVVILFIESIALEEKVESDMNMSDISK
jgi:hypothetical protein